MPAANGADDFRVSMTEFRIGAATESATL